MAKFLSCDCGKWADVPIEFRENKHFGKCPVCNQLMFLIHMDPIKDLAYRERDKVTAELVNQ